MKALGMSVPCIVSLQICINEGQTRNQTQRNNLNALAFRCAATGRIVQMHSLVVSWLPHPELAVSNRGHAGSGLDSGGPDGHSLGLSSNGSHCL